MTDAISRLAAFIARALIIIGGIATTMMIFHTLAEVVARSFFRSPIPGTMEISSYYYLIPLCFLPLATVELRREHVIVESFTHFLPPRWIKNLDIAVRILCLLCVIIFTWRTGVEAVFRTNRAEFYSATYFNVPIWPIRWVLPISFAAFALAILSNLLKDLGSGTAQTEVETSGTGN